MKIVLFGASGTRGSAVKKALEVKGHGVIDITRKSGQFRADIQDIESLKSRSVHNIVVRDPAYVYGFVESSSLRLCSVGRSGSSLGSAVVEGWL